MSLILEQFVSELFLTMCKVYQNFYNQIVYKNRIICLICSINLLEPSLLLKFNTFINILTTFPFNSSHPTLMHLLSCCLVSRFVDVLFNKSRSSIKSSIQLKTIQHNHNFILSSIPFNQKCCSNLTIRSK